MASEPLPRSSPGAQRVEPNELRAFRDALDDLGGIDSVMVVRHGQVVFERWWNEAAPEAPHILHSISKSFTSTAAGFAVTEGLLRLDDRVVDLLTDAVPTTVSPTIGRVTVEHLLTMTAGWGSEAMPQDERDLTSSWTRHILSKPLMHEPGTTFVYNSGSSYLVSALVQRVTGERIADYLRPRLFDPLGIGEARWLQSPEGVNTGGWGLYLTTEELARFALFCLGGGEFLGRRILDGDWMRAATTRHVATAGPETNPDWSLGYGYQFWQCRHGAFRGDGARGQLCLVLPDQDAVVAVTADLDDMQGELDLIWDRLLPAFG